MGFIQHVHDKRHKQPSNDSQTVGSFPIQRFQQQSLPERLQPMAQSAQASIGWSHEPKSVGFSFFLILAASRRATFSVL